MESTETTLARSVLAHLPPNQEYLNTVAQQSEAGHGNASLKTTPTEPLPIRALAHLIDAHKWDSSYAEKSARNFARLDPFQLSEMPELLKKSLQKPLPQDRAA